MYLEVKDMKKSYGENGSYTQVLKGIGEIHFFKLHRRPGQYGLGLC